VPHETAFVRTRLDPTHVLQAGTGHVAVGYLPGTNLNTATSLTLLARLCAHCRVFAVDLAGQPGLSAPRRPRQQTRACGSLLSDVRAALPGKGIERVVMVGHSRGAAAALCAHPAEADGLVLLNPTGLAKVAVSRAVLRTAISWRVRPTGARTRALLQLMIADGHEPDADHVSWHTMVARETRTTGPPGPVPRSCTDRWRSKPVVVLAGADDHFFPADRLASAAHDRLGAGLEVLPDVGHLSVAEAPSVVAARILAFLFPTKSV
jgi:pimeloyl-ACP methyl ester carboxylesterase